MRRGLRWHHSVPNLVLLACVILFSASAVISFKQSRTQYDLASSQANAVMFAVASFERELLKLLSMLRPLADVELNYYQDGAFRIQFEIFWSRLNVLTQGREAADVRELDSFESVLEQSLAALQKVERLLGGSIAEPELELVRERLNALLEPAHALVMDAYTELALNADYTREQLTAVDWKLFGSSAGIVLSGVTLLLLLFHQIRTSRGLLRSSEQARSRLLMQAENLGREMVERKRAEAEVRRLNQDLERRVEERTAELRESQAQLVRKERLAALGQVAATVSHELRNPLGTIRASLEIVRSRVARAGLHLDRTLERIDRNIRRCDLIIEELLDYGRTGCQHTEATVIDAWLDELLTEYEMTADVAIKRDLRAGVELKIDRERLTRALFNVLDNALQADAQAADRKAGGSMTVQVGSEITSGRLEISVRDHGAGIPEALLPRVFEPLVSSKSFGVGLGLPTARNILRQHGGDMELDSHSRNGTVVRLWIPLVDPPSQIQPASAG